MAPKRSQGNDFGPADRLLTLPGCEQRVGGRTGRAPFGCEQLDEHWRARRRGKAAARGQGDEHCCVDKRLHRSHTAHPTFFDRRARITDQSLLSVFHRLEGVLDHEAADLRAHSNALLAAGAEVYAPEHPGINGFGGCLRKAAVAARDARCSERI